MELLLLRKVQKMGLRLLAGTIRHLKIEQLFFQAAGRLHKPHLRKLQASAWSAVSPTTHFIPKQVCLNDGKFSFLNRESVFNGWNDNRNGKLWAYNLNYMDWLMQDGITPRDCTDWIDRFISDIDSCKIGLDPYPTALRCMNWIKLFSMHHETAIKERIDSLYSQISLLSCSIERHLLGNHILEDAIALTMGACVFPNSPLGKKALKLLQKELPGQILPDGAHFEQSPMYHCIILEHLLDCINLIQNSDTPFMQEAVSLLRPAATSMTGHLKSIIWQDGTIPLPGDSAYGITSKPNDILDYALRLGIDSPPLPMKECGYRRMDNGNIQVIADVGNITASYQPGHSHADTFSYELRINGQPFIVDTGISTYDKSSRRQYERSTQAHNTVTVDGKDSSKVWGGFRVAGRARVKIEQENDYLITACHDGFGRNSIHTRSFRLENGSFSIQDTCNTPKDTVSRIHFAPDVKILSADTSQIVTDKATILIKGAIGLNIKDVETAVEYNRTNISTVAEISFLNNLAYTLNINP